MNTLSESYTLPSGGRGYDKPIDPHFTIHSMTTEDEMAKLSPTDRPYKVMCDIIERRLEKKFAIPVYDLCIGDYQYLLHKLRIVTYGTDYKIVVRCSECGALSEINYNLEDLKTIELDDTTYALRTIDLPSSKKQVVLNIQTPRMLDNIALDVAEIKKKSKEFKDPSLLVTLGALINTIDGNYYSPIQKEQFIRNLPMRDTNIILQTAELLNKACGLSSEMECECKECKHKIKTPFRLTSEFYYPSIN